MPRVIPEEEYSSLLKILQELPDGASISQLLAIPEINYPRRTLQRRLESMCAAGKIEIQGKTRALKYMLPERSHLKHAPIDIPFSAEAKSIRASVIRPLSHRQKVGYKRSLLDYYQPNQSNYLNLALKQELASVGRLGASHSPPGTYLRQNIERFTLDLSWHSSRLEGNTYTLQEAQNLISRNEAASSKNTEETQMLLNHQVAIESLSSHTAKPHFDRHTICNLHGLLADNLLANPAEYGKVRHREMRIPASVYTPLYDRQQIETRFAQTLTKASAIIDPFEQAFFILVHIPYLQPFEHLNNNVARLAANIPLAHFNLCPLSFADIPRDDYLQAMMGIYELNRVDYLRDLFVWAYKRSAAYYSVAKEYLGEPDPFRLKYRHEIRDLVHFIVCSGKNSTQSNQLLRQEISKKFAPELQSQCLDVIQTELASMHEGNITRYRLTPNELRAWKYLQNQSSQTSQKAAENKDQLHFEW